MFKKIIYIKGQDNFMAQTVENNLIDEGFQVIPVPESVSDLDQHKDEADQILYYMSGYLDNSARVLNLLKSIYDDVHKSISLIGEPIMLQNAVDILEYKRIAAQYKRPLDVRQMIADMNTLAQAYGEVEQLKTILIVDDDNDFLKMMTEWLKDHYKIDVVNSGDKALKYLERHKPDLILLDHNMPGKNGPEVMEEIREKPNLVDIPVIFLTGVNDREIVEKVISQRPEGYILKSMSKEDIIKTINRFFVDRIMAKKMYSVQ